MLCRHRVCIRAASRLKNTPPKYFRYFKANPKKSGVGGFTAFDIMFGKHKHREGEALLMTTASKTGHRCSLTKGETYLYYLIPPAVIVLILVWVKLVFL